jgi:hypothetical protein
MAEHISWALEAPLLSADTSSHCIVKSASEVPKTTAVLQALYPLALGRWQALKKDNPTHRLSIAP